MYRIQYAICLEGEFKLYYGGWYSMDDNGTMHIEQAFSMGVVHDVDFKLI